MPRVGVRSIPLILKNLKPYLKEKHHDFKIDQFPFKDLIKTLPKIVFRSFAKTLIKTLF